MKKIIFLIFPGCFFLCSCAKEIIRPSATSDIDNVIASYIASNSVTDSITRVQWQYNDQNYSAEQLGIYTVIPDHNPDNGHIAGCTGLAYNTRTNQFAVAFYNGSHASKIWLYNRKSLIPYNSTSVIVPIPSGQIDVSAYIDYIEGIDYDAGLQSYWAIGTKKGTDKNNNNRVLIRVDESGSLIESYDLSPYSFEPGMLVNVGSYLIIKPDDQYWLLVLDKMSKAVIGQYQTFTKNEGLGINKINGDIWLADDDGTIMWFTSRLKQLGAYRSTTFGNEVEGLLVDPADGTLWDAADAYFHSSKLNGNALWHYDFAKTYKKFVRFPEMADFTKGIAGGGLKIKANSINGSGTWESPVVDFEVYKDFLKNGPVITQRGKTITIEYRGSDTPPTTPVNNDMSCNYYQGWGNTMPGDYAKIPSDHRYQQIRLTIQ